jgi:RND family efflux transporter MFP subunit
MGRWFFSPAWKITVFGAMLLAAGCSQAPSTPKVDPPQVDVTTPVTGTVTDYEDFTGRLDALKTTDIRARVSGYVIKAPFKEGDEVHEGELLFEIDPRTYEADVNQAEANLKLAIADRNLQERNAKRGTTLVRSNAMSQEDYDTVVATAEKARATVKATEAMRNRAKLYVDYTKVIAPWTGRISRRLVDPGNLVNADNTVLTTMVTENPLYAYFDVNERTYLDLVEAGTTKQNPAEMRFPVLMQLANEGEFTRPGTVDFVDNRVNAMTGTIRMRGVFPNDAMVLKPGLFVRIRLPIGARYQALLIPDEAILIDQGRKYVFVVNDQNKVIYRPVELGQEIQKLRVIKKGLAPDERVIISGTQRVRAEDEVRPNNKKPPSPPESRLSQLLASWKPAKPVNGRVGDKEAKKASAKETGSPASGSAGSGN